MKTSKARLGEGGEDLGRGVDQGRREDRLAKIGKGSCHREAFGCCRGGG
jgi:hypothetical protein